MESSVKEQLDILKRIHHQKATYRPDMQLSDDVSASIYLIALLQNFPTGSARENTHLYLYCYNLPKGFCQTNVVFFSMKCRLYIGGHRYKRD